jgi:hypothetical protein
MWLLSQLKPNGLQANRAHEAFSLKPSRNSCFCSPGRHLKNLVIENSSISGSPLSRLAPARKSSVGSLLPAGVCDREFRRLPGQDFRLLEQRVFQDAPSSIFMASVK